MKDKKRNLSLKRLTSFVLAGILAVSFAGCGSSRKTKEVQKNTFGVDVAKYQGNIDWLQAASTGIDFAMVRVGYRTMADGEINEDSSAMYNLQEASKAGVSLGAYFFSTAVTEEEAVEEAKWLAERIAPYPITYPVAYDCEGYTDPQSRQYGLSAEKRTDIALAFLETIEDLGYEGMFYSSKNEMTNDAQWEMSRIQKDYKIWVAQYPAEPYPMTPASSYEGEHHMWQYTTEGDIFGISQNVDLNVAYFGYDGIEPPKDDRAPETVGPDVEALMNFQNVLESVTAKDETSLRSVPSQDDDSVVLNTLYNGQVAKRIAISDKGWSKVEFEGNVYYAVSSYLTTDLHYDADAAVSEQDDGIQTQFSPVNRQVTAKDVVNLRAMPSVEHEGAVIIGQLKKGDVATCVGVSENGWSKLLYKGTTCYCVSSYLTDYTSSASAAVNAGDADIQTEFEPMNDQVTAKEEVNLRALPSVTDPAAVVVATIRNGDVVLRTGINRDVGWSRVDYNGQTLYCVSSYLTAAGG